MIAQVGQDRWFRIVGHVWPDRVVVLAELTEQTVEVAIIEWLNVTQQLFIERAMKTLNYGVLPWALITDANRLDVHAGEGLLDNGQQYAVPVHYHGFWQGIQVHEGIA